MDIDGGGVGIKYTVGHGSGPLAYVPREIFSPSPAPGPGRTVHPGRRARGPLLPDAGHRHRSPEEGSQDLPESRGDAATVAMY